MGLEDILTAPSVVLGVLLLFSFLPPILFLIWVRNSERYAREPWRAVIKVFVWGAVFAVIIAILLSMGLSWIYNKVAPPYVLFGSKQTIEALLLVFVIAPFVEEGAKAIGIYTAAFNVTEVEDGIVYGAASGLGFSATENLFYGVAAMVALGPAISVQLIVLRSVSSTLLHASATSTTGLGIGRNMVSNGKYRVLPFYLMAVTMHAAFNFFASFGGLYRGTFGDIADTFGFWAALIFAVVAFSLMRFRILKKDIHPA